MLQNQLEKKSIRLAKRSAKKSRFLVDLKEQEEKIDEDNYQDYYSRYTKFSLHNEDFSSYWAEEKVEKIHEKLFAFQFFNFVLKMVQFIFAPFFVARKKTQKAPAEPKIELIPSPEKPAKKSFVSPKNIAIAKSESTPFKEAKTVTEKIDEEIFYSWGRRGFGLASFRSAVAFGLFMAFFVLPFKGFDLYEYIQNQKGDVLGVSEEAISNLFVASSNASNMNFEEAQKSFLEAETNFHEIGERVGNWKILLNILGKIIPSEKLRLGASVDNVVRAGELGAKIGESLSQIMVYVADKDMTNQGKILLIERQLSEIKNNTELLNQEIGKIDSSSLPEEQREIFVSLQQKSVLIQAVFNEIQDLIRALKIFSGFEYDKRYLLVFQNNSELRASGGFIGSFAIIDLSQGEIKNIEIPGGGSYDTAGGLYSQIISPKPLQLVSPRWYFWDANWWPDWPRSAEKLAWFLSESQGPSVDGVISFTPSVLESMLGLSGEVYLEKYDLSVNSENFWEITQTFSEQKPPDHPEYQLNPYLDASSTEDLLDYQKPKQIIGELFNVLRENLKNNISKNSMISLFEIFSQAIEEKQILLNFKNDTLQAKVEEYRGDGKILNTKYDYLQVVNTNIAGQKSDRVIDNQYLLNTEIKEDGSIVNTLVIKRIHNGVKRTRFTGVRNVDWLRVYVPEGSELLSAQGFRSPDEEFFEEPEATWQVDKDLAKGENLAMTHQYSQTKVYHELGKTVFANWLMLDPGETARVEIKYRLPFKLGEVNPEEKAHLLTWQKQAGDLNTEIALSFDFGVNNEVVENGGDNSCIREGCSLDTDKFWYFVFK